MRILKSFQREAVADAVRGKFAMAAPILEATLYSVAMERIERLDGYASWTLADLAREFREGDGDAGICFEWAVHEAMVSRNPLIWPLTSDVLDTFCGISDGANSFSSALRRMDESQSSSPFKTRRPQTHVST